METKAYPCLVAFQGHDWQNEFRGQSKKTGRTITIYCNGKWDRFSAALAALIHKYQNVNYEDLPWSSYPKHPEIMSIELLHEITILSKEDRHG